MITLRTSGQPAVHRHSEADAAAHAERRRGDRELIDARSSTSSATDADSLRVPAQRLLDFLRMITLSSVHPFMRDRRRSAAEIVDVALNGLSRSQPNVEGELMLIRITRTLLAPYRRLITGLVLLQLVGTMASLYLPSLNGKIIDNGVAKGDTGYILRTGG